MRICPSCGYRNTDEAETCLFCDYQLIEPAQPLEDDLAPIPLPGAASASGRPVLPFVLGVGLGVVPALITAIANVSSWGSSGCYLFVFMLILMGVFLSQKNTRAFGYGLLAAVLISPIIIVVSCTVAPRAA
jgi:hypothetical protein